MKGRKINFELLRIVAIIMVISVHFIYYGKVEQAVDKNSVNYILVCIVKTCLSVCVNLFILLTGYFGIGKEFEIKKVFKIWLIILFYSILGELFVSGGYRAIIDKTVLFPVVHKRWYYATYYLTLYIISPFLNIGLNNMTKKMFLRCVIVLGLGCILIPSVPQLSDLFMIGGGFSIGWFIYLYVVGAYVGKYIRPKERWSTFTFWFLLYLGGACAGGILRLKNIYQMLGYENQDLGYNYNFIIISFCSICIFVSFVNIRDGAVKCKTIILNISSTVFGIYLFHEHPIIRDLIWNKIFKPYQYANSLYVWGYMIFCVLCIMGIGFIIEKIRYVLFAVFQTVIKISGDKLKSMRWRKMC